MRNYKLTIYLGIALLTVLFSSYVLTAGLKIIDSEILKMPARIISLFLCIIAILIKHKIKASMLGSALILLTILLINNNLILLNIIYILLIISALNHLESKHFSLILFISTLSMFFIHLVAIGTNLVDLNSYEVNERIRFTLGFANANQFAVVYLSIALTAVYLHTEYQSKWSMAVLVAATTMSFGAILISDSRTSFLILIVLLFWLIFCKKIKKITLFFGPVILMLSVAITVLMLINNTEDLNLLLSYRPKLFIEFLSKHNFLEYFIGWEVADNEGVDNAYLMMISALGLPLFIFVIGFIFIRIRQISFIYIPFISMLLLGSSLESFVLRPELPVSILFFWILFSEKSIPPNIARKSPAVKVYRDSSIYLAGQQ